MIEVTGPELAFGGVIGAALLGLIGLLIRELSAAKGATSRLLDQMSKRIDQLNSVVDSLTAQVTALEGKRRDDARLIRRMGDWIDHLEDILRDHGVTPPDRPDDL